MRTSEFTIRDFRRGDFDALWKIDQTCFPPGISYSQIELLSYIRRPRSFTLVADGMPNDPLRGDEAEPVGFIVAEAGRTRGHIITIDVLQHARRGGLGTRLLTLAETRLREMGCSSVLLETAVDNAVALAFYKRQRYFLLKTVPRYYSTGVDAFVLKKDLLSPTPAS